MDKTKASWEYLGKTEPYFAVATIDKFREKNLDASAMEEFFASGSEHISDIWSDVKKYFEKDFTSKYALDFGCGVGRLTIPLASKAEKVIGVDISEEMIAEARRNCISRKIENIDFLQTDDFLAKEQKYDFVHSHIVFQHIRPDIGISILRTILRRLVPGGIGALHFTYAAETDSGQSFAFRMYRDYPFTYKIRSLFTGYREPLIPIYLYDLNQIVKELHKHGCHDSIIRHTHHGLYGGLFIFRKSLDSLY